MIAVDLFLRGFPEDCIRLIELAANKPHDGVTFFPQGGYKRSPYKSG
jgi:hypothetical protein